jgi:peptidoglycan/xylan/chitin deacetylase (PgdA/CDA1 family)
MTARGPPVEPRMRLPDASPGRLVVALTLDACPGGFDERIATALVEGGIKATIFVTGLWLRENPVGLAFLLAHRDLFVLENHGELAYPAGPRPPANLRHFHRR